MDMPQTRVVSEYVCSETISKEECTMKIHYNITKEQRKKTVEIVGRTLGVQPIYCGAPTFAYKVGAFEITRDGSI